MSRLVKIVFLIALILLLISFFYLHVLPTSDFSELSFNVPEQEQTEKENITLSKDEYRAEIEPKFDYELWGVVVADYDSENIFDFIHKNDPFNTHDLCIVWGENLKDGLYARFEYKHGEFTCSYGTRDLGAYRSFNKEQISNNHLIPASENVYKIIKDVQIGDQVHFSGALASYQVSGKDGLISSRGTSISREDTGDGACEVVYVTDFEITKEANILARRIFSFSKYCLGICLFLMIILFFVDSRKLLKVRIDK